MIKIISDFIFPKKCFCCGEYIDENKLCYKCWKKLNFISKPCCNICSYPFEFEEDEEAICGACIANKPEYNKAISIFRYDLGAREIIHKFKYEDKLQILDYLTDLLNNSISHYAHEIDVITIVPLAKMKLLKRGYNQAALLAMKLAQRHKFLYLPELLIRRKNNISQVSLKKEKRLKNVKNNFAINNSYVNLIKGKNILLIDDVITTGATVNECSLKLKQFQPNKIFVLSVAKTIT